MRNIYTQAEAIIQLAKHLLSTNEDWIPHSSTAYMDLGVYSYIPNVRDEVRGSEVQGHFNDTMSWRSVWDT